MNTLRFGVLGSSRIAKKAVLPVITESTLTSLIMIGSRSPEKSSDLGVPMGTYDEVLANPKIDAVYISLPNSLHEEWSIKAARAGKHIWCEKPAALSYDSAQRMVAAARENNVRLMEGFMFRHHPQHAKVREIINSGRIGDITGFEGQIAYPRPDSSNIRMDQSLGGGFYFDALVYPINAARMYLGEPESVSCTLDLDPQTRVDIKDRLLFFYPGGRAATISGEFTDDYASTYKIIGTKGSVRMGRAYAVPKDMAVSIYIETGEQTEEIVIPPFDHFVPMLEEFVKEVLSNTKSINYEQRILDQAKAVYAGVLSNTEKREVRLDEIS